MAPFNSEIIDNQYLAIRLLKRGGFGVVYSGWELSLNIPIAIKEIHYQLGLDEQSVASFSAEAQIVARLDHPGICRVYAHKRLPDGRIFMVMEFIDGRGHSPAGRMAVRPGEADSRRCFALRD